MAVVRRVFPECFRSVPSPFFLATLCRFVTDCLALLTLTRWHLRLVRPDQAQSMSTSTELVYSARLAAVTKTGFAVAAVSN